MGLGMAMYQVWVWFHTRQGFGFQVRVKVLGFDQVWADGLCFAYGYNSGFGLLPCSSTRKGFYYWY